jgi:hypothetical protein
MLQLQQALECLVRPWLYLKDSCCVADVNSLNPRTNSVRWYHKPQFTVERESKQPQVTYLVSDKSNPGLKPGLPPRACFTLCYVVLHRASIMIQRADNCQVSGPVAEPHIFSIRTVRYFVLLPVLSKSGQSNSSTVHTVGLLNSCFVHVVTQTGRHSHIVYQSRACSFVAKKRSRRAGS